MRQNTKKKWRLIKRLPDPPWDPDPPPPPRVVDEMVAFDQLPPELRDFCNGLFVGFGDVSQFCLNLYCMGWSSQDIINTITDQEFRLLDKNRAGRKL